MRLTFDQAKKAMELATLGHGVDVEPCQLPFKMGYGEVAMATTMDPEEAGCPNRRLVQVVDPSGRVLLSEKWELDG